MIEYWLQKKTIGGWSHVTYYVTEAEARINFNKVSGDLNGYCWRLVKAEVIEEKLLNDVVEIDLPKMYEEPLKTGIINQAKSGWGNLIPAIPKSNSWGEPKRGETVTNSWSGINTKSDKFWGDDINGNHIEKEHGLSGSVWVINHSTKDKKRVAVSELDAMLKNGYERGGPRTQFRE